jgi:hypothetical protein
MIEGKTTPKIKKLSEYEESLKNYQSKNSVQIIIDLDGAGFDYREILYQFKKPMLHNKNKNIEKFFSYIKKYPLCFLFVLVSIAKENYVEKRFWPYFLKEFYLTNINEGLVETRIREFVTGFLKNYEFLRLYPESERLVDIFGIVAHAKVPTAYYDLYSNFIGNLFDLLETETDAIERLKLWRELYQRENVSKKQAVYYQDKFQTKEELSEILNALSKDVVFEASSRLMVLLKTQPHLVLNQKSLWLLKRIQGYIRLRSQLIAEGLSKIEIINQGQSDYETFKEKINKNNLNIFNSLKKPMRFFLLYGGDYAEAFLVESLNHLKQSDKSKRSKGSDDVHEYTKKQYAYGKKQNFNLSSVGWGYSFEKGIHLEIGKIRIDDDFRKQYHGNNQFWLVVRNKNRDFVDEFQGGFNMEGLFDSNGSTRFSLDIKNPQDVYEIIIQDISDKEFFLCDDVTLLDDFCVFLKVGQSFKQLSDDFFPGNGELYIWHKKTIAIEGKSPTYDEQDQVTILQNKVQDEVRILDCSSPDEPLKILRRLDSLNPRFDLKHQIKGLVVEGEENVFSNYPEIRFNPFDLLKNWTFQVDNGDCHEVSSPVIDLEKLCPRRRSLYSFDHFRRYKITFINSVSHDKKEMSFFLFPYFSFETGGQVFSDSSERIKLTVTSEKIVNFRLRGTNIHLVANQSSHEQVYDYTPEGNGLSLKKIVGILSCRDDLQKEINFRIQLDIPFFEIFEKANKIKLTAECISFDKLTEFSIQTNREFNRMKIGIFKEKTDSKALAYQIIRINRQKRFNFKELISKKSLLPLDEPVYLHVKFSQKFKHETSFTPVCTVINDTEDDDW